MPTYRCLYDDERRFVLDNLRELVAQAGQRERRLRHPDRQPGDRRPAERPGARRSRTIRATGSPSRSSALDGADAVRRRRRAPPRRPAPVHPHRRDELRDGRRADPGRPAEGLARRQLVAGRRQQGHLDRRPRRRLGQRTDVLLSRVAGRIYWAARYIERAEDTARIVRAHGELMADLPPQIETRWEPLVAVVGSDVRFRDVDTAGASPSQQSRPSRSRSRSRNRSRSRRRSRSRSRTARAHEESSSSSPASSSPIATTRAASSAASSRRARTCARRATRCPATAGTSLNDLYLYVTTEADRGVDRRVRERFLDARHRRQPAHRRRAGDGDDPRRGVRDVAPRPGASSGPT